MAYILSQRSNFLNELCALDPKELAHVAEKLKLLCNDPSPDGSAKKRLKYLGGKLHRLRSGKYRVIYTYDSSFVSLIALRKREDDTYDEDFDPEFLGGLDFEPEAAAAPTPKWERPVPPAGQSPGTPLPEPITEALLKRLQVPGHCFKKLLKVQTEDELFNCPGVPDEVKLKVHQALFETPIEQALQAPELVVHNVDDLLRFHEGDLLGFLLKLDPEQEKFVTRNLSGTGPTLLKGAPGTGKSTVAIYRVRELIRTLPFIPVKPRILFTTYTNALVAFSRQLLDQLLGADASLVDVRTADSLVRAIVGKECTGKILGGREAEAAVARAVETAEFEGNELVRKAQREALKKLSAEYLSDEICGVIEGRGLETLEAYLEAPRPGRLVPLKKLQRQAVWAVRERLVEELRRANQWTWERLRRRALRIVEEKPDAFRYDAVVVDEAQDLDPVVLALLTRVCVDPSRLFITADANQSIYGSGFRWKDVHEDLKFHGSRSGTLRTNHRSTKEVGLAAGDYLASGLLEEVEEKVGFEHSGAIPAVRAVASREAEVALLVRFLREASREARLPSTSSAVLVPSEKTGKPLAEALTAAGLPAEFMKGTDLDLKKAVVKIVTLKSAKGLEFPVVALAGFVGLAADGFEKESAEETDEALRRERRSYFVGMTRAMRALLVVIPEGTKSPLLNGFSKDFWNVG